MSRLVFQGCLHFGECSVRITRVPEGGSHIGAHARTFRMDRQRQRIILDRVLVLLAVVVHVSELHQGIVITRVLLHCFDERCDLLLQCSFCFGCLGLGSVLLCCNRGGLCNRRCRSTEQVP